MRGILLRGRDIRRWDIRIGGIQAGVTIFIDGAFAFHVRLALQIAVVGDIADNPCVRLDALHLWVVGHLRKLALTLLEVGVVTDVRLDFCVLSDAAQLGRDRHCRRFRLWDVGLAVWLLVHAFVVPHVERHPADFAFETDLVPYFVETLEFLGGIHRLLTSRAALAHVFITVSHRGTSLIDPSGGGTHTG